MGKKSMTYIEQYGDAVAVQSNAYKLTLNLTVQDLLELQDKYTTLQCECMRFADWVLNMLHDCCAIAIKFNNEYLNVAGNMLFKSFGRIPNPDHEEIIKELKK